MKAWGFKFHVQNLSFSLNELVSAYLWIRSACFIKQEAKYKFQVILRKQSLRHFLLLAMGSSDAFAKGPLHDKKTSLILQRASTLIVLHLKQKA